MKKLTKKQLSKRYSIIFKVLGIVFLVLAVLLIVLIAAFIVFLVIGIICLIVSSKYKKIYKNMPSNTDQNDISVRELNSDSSDNKTSDNLAFNKKNDAVQEIVNSHLQFKHNNLHIFIYNDYTHKSDGSRWIAKYTYDNVKIFRPDTSFNEIFEYDILNVLQEPKNKYDNRAIVFNFSGITIGYLHKGKLQDMANDYIDHGDEVHAQVQKIDNNDIYVKLFFCKPRSQTLRSVDSFIVKLVGNSNSEMQDNISFCSELDDITVEWDDEKDKYIVSSDGFEIGYIPKSEQDRLKILDEEHYELVGEIYEISENESSGKYSIKVKIQPE